MSFRRAAPAVALLFLLAGCAGAPVPDVGTDSPPADLESPPEDPDGVDPDDPDDTAWTGTVVDVTDGDTMDVRLPSGSIETVRLLGVDTPETSVGEVSPDEWEGIPDTTDARDWLVNWGGDASSYAERRLEGREVYIKTDPEADRRGYYGRLLVYISQSENSETSFNERLLTNGYARYYDSEFSQQASYQDAENEAQTGDMGVWDYKAPEAATPAAVPDGGGGGTVVVANVHADAEGNDNENLNDEYVIFKNTGSEVVDLSGWTVSDEADHVYYFYRKSGAYYGDLYAEIPRTATELIDFTEVM